MALGHISNYPSGFANGITIRGVPVQMLYPGEVFWVNNSGVLPRNGIGASNQNPGTYQKPKSTIAGAIDACTASRGDVIIVMPGHSETITTDGGLALDTAGVAIIGLGYGTLRPKIVLDSAAAAAITVTAANVTLQNFVIEASFADITNAIDVTASWFSLIDCEFVEEGTNLNFLDYVHCSSTTDNNADGLTIVGCKGFAVDEGQNSFLNVKADLHRLIFNENYYHSTHANTLQAILVATGKDLTGLECKRNQMVTGATGAPSFISCDTTANEGIVAFNLVGHHDTAAAELADVDGVRHFENYSASSDGVSGALEPAADPLNT